MPKAPITRLKKSEIVWLHTHRCRHGHNYLEHYSCFLDESPKDSPMNLTMGFLDIETSNLKANMGVIYSYCIKDSASETIYERLITKKELFSDDMDKQVVKSLIKDIQKFDILVTYYGTRFDIPFIRSRAVHHGLDYPSYGENIHIDLYYLIRNKFNLTRNSLKVACQFLLGETDKTIVEYKHWMKAMQGNKEALDYIIEHNRYDVLDLEKLYDKIIPFRKRMDTSA